MGQLTIYLPAETEKAVKDAARRAKKSVSAYLASLVAGKPKRGDWPKGYRSVLGSWKGEFPEGGDPLPDEVDPL